MLSRISIKIKVILVSVLAVLGVGALIGTLAVNTAIEAIEALGIAHLESIRTIKKNQIEQYGQLLQTNLQFFSKDKNTRQMIHEFVEVHKNLPKAEALPIDEPRIKAIHAKYEAHFQNYADAYKYYDLFIICQEHGHVLYSVAKESDFGISLSTNPQLKNSGLAKLWRKVVSTGKTATVDMEPYAPSNNEPAMFIGMPVWQEKKMVGVVAIQISDKVISAIMQDRSGLGKTGQTYLVGQDQLMRSDSLLTPEHSLRASFADPEKGRLNIKAVTETLQGKHGRLIDKDHKGHLALFAFETVNFAGIKWAIIAEIHKAELFKDAYTIHKNIFWFGLLTILGVILANLLILRKILMSPLQSFQEGLLGFFAYLNRETALAQRIKIHSQDELGQMSQLVNNNIRKIEKGIIQDNQLIANVAEIVSKTKAGKLQERVTKTAHNPALNDLKLLLNELLAVMTGVLADVGNNLNKLAEGQLNARVTQNYEGEYARLKNACNDIAEQIQNIFGEINTTLRKMVDGNMEARIIGEFVGDFAGIKASTNAMAENLQKLVYEVSNVLCKFAEGNMAMRISGEFLGDFTKIKQASNTMANDIQAIIEETRQTLAQLANGDTQVQIKGEFPGHFETVKQALETTAQKLAEATAQNTLQDWFKTGQNRLSTQMRGQKTVIQLAEDIINFLVPYLEVQVGAFYLLKEDEEKQVYLKMIASYAYTWRKSAVYEFKIGEGIVGQAALERKMFVITKAPNDYMSIQSGLGEAMPTAILVAPFVYENKLKGVIELASFTPFTENQLEFMHQVLPMFAIVMNTAEIRAKRQALLEQSQAQAEQLRTQQAELQHVNEELKNQTEELQSQSEELQVQQEELRQANEELEEHAHALQLQKIAVQEKNAELEQAKLAIQTNAKELELTNKYKSEFLANVSHDLRSSLNNMQILAQLLINNQDNNLTNKQVEYAQTIHTSGSDLLNLLNDILDLSKVEAGKIAINPAEVVIADLITSIEQKFRFVAENKGLNFAIHLAAGLPTTLYTDEQRLKQITTNLLSNALKFTHKGSVTLNIQRPAADLSQCQLNPANTIVISVTDTGIGISQDKQKIIFDAFQQADDTTSRDYGGTGLGLSISRQLIELLGGEIFVQSEEGRGSTFTLYLPEKFAFDESLTTSSHRIEPKPEEQQTQPSVSASIASSPAPKLDTSSLEKPQDDRENLQSGDKTLLIIEDDRQFSKILMELAKEKDFKVLLAEDGKKGLQLVETYQPGAIILDVGLPQMDGWTVMDQLKDNPETRHIPVHFVSGANNRQEARTMGAIGYCLKPVTMTELGDAFKNIEGFISQTVKNLLVIVDNPQHQQAIVDLVHSEQIQPTVTATRAEAWQQLHDNHYDCIVLDVSVETDKGIQLLEQLYQAPKLSQIPVIIYAERELTIQEEVFLQQCAVHLTVKEVHSPERLLDETTLFLHQVESKLSQKQQQLLQKVHDKEAILVGKKVLLADDDRRNIFALGATLKEKGMDVIVADNGRKALKCLTEHPDIAAVLMDVMMPDMDGYEAMRKIRAQPQFRKLPIIALTAKAMKGDKVKCIEAGANDYLAKPVDGKKLLSLLRVWLYQ
jgi:signal transduction histidine kinase/DNA-binding response OmpR family regulator/methyl-accepting chemotaxis protein